MMIVIATVPGRCGGQFVAALVALLVSAQVCSAADRLEEASPSSLARMAEETLADFGFAAPPVPTSTNITVTAVVPPESALNVAVSTDVTVTFSEEVDPITVTTTSFRLLDSGGLPVAAQVSVSPTNLQATLNPDSALGFDELHTVEVTADVENSAGRPNSLFTSQFVTATAPAQEELPEASEAAAPPPNPTQAKTGTACSAAGNLNVDAIPPAIADFIAGAPGLLVGSEVEAGAVLVYLGSSATDELVQPDIIFLGESAHDRAGVSVAGNFDFNGDGIADILIGAEQVNRTTSDDRAAGCDAGAACGNGKVYLIYFDPLDYPNIDDPGVIDFVDLSLVGGSIPGVVFTGTALGDQAGFAVAGGGRVNSGTGQDIIIGAPGANPGSPARVNAGAAYVIFDDASLSGTIALDRVANGQGDQIEGVIYEGGAAGDNLGFSVAFPGDVMGAIGDDIAMGAPGFDPTPLSATSPEGALEDAGSVVIPQAGDLSTGIIESCTVGIGTTGTQVQGDQAGMQLGFSVAGGGDNLVDGQQDLLMGAPTYDAQDELGNPLPDAGLVAQTASTMPNGIIESCTVGNGVNGVLYTGAAAGDQLGSAVVGLGDVTGDGYEDVALGAPFSDPLVNELLQPQRGIFSTLARNRFGMTPVTDAGTVYVVNGTVPADLNLGIIESCTVGVDVAGTQLTGAEEEEHAGSSLCFAGDVNGDDNLDFLVGSPDLDVFAADDNAGTVYIVLESTTEFPGTCGPEGCVVAHLETGAQIAVPAGSLSETVGLAVKGVLEVALLPVPPLPDMTLLGATDFDPEAQTFGAPQPTIHVPVRPGLEGQFVGGEVLDLWFLSGGFWADSGIDGSVQTNPHYPTLRAIEANVDTLHFYVVFILDVDGDNFWDTNDSDPRNPFECADTDGDGCDDCFTGTYDPANDGDDNDGDGTCDEGDPDDDNDGVEDGLDSDPFDPNVCRDVDLDTCDDCSSGTDDPANDGPDFDGDGLCDEGDPDDDNDGVEDGLDCASTNPQLWATPGVVGELLVQQSSGVTLVSWTEPIDPGTTLPLLYDTVGSDVPSDFVTGAVCVETDGPDTESTDMGSLPSGQAIYYLARAQNGCGDGLLREGTFGPRTVIACP